MVIILVVIIVILLTFFYSSLVLAKEYDEEMERHKWKGTKDSMALQYSIIKERYEVLKKEIKEKDKINDIFCNYYTKTTEELIKGNKKAKQYKKIIDKATNKLYEWGEALDPEFQKIMLDILKGDNNE